MQKPDLLLAVLAVAWTAMDVGSVAYAARDTQITIVTVSWCFLLAVLVCLWLRK